MAQNMLVRTFFWSFYPEYGEVYCQKKGNYIILVYDIYPKHLD